MSKEEFSPRKRAGVILGLILLFLFLILFVLIIKEDGNQITDITDWDSVYGAQYPSIEDYDELVSRGINLVVNNITTEPGEWDRYYHAVVERDLDIIPILWGADQTAWIWNQASNEWELDINKYPNSIGARFLQYLRDHPNSLQHTYAIYAFHEPFNPENPKLVSPDKIQKFWQQIHEEEFPDRTLRVSMAS